MGFYTDNFQTIFGVKDNIQALRNKVLELAIQGKLVEQDSNDEPASELVKKIKTERNILIKEGKAKKVRPLAPINEEEKFFEIPYNWVFVRLGDLGDWGSGATPKRGVVEYWTNGMIPWLKTGELNNSYIIKAEEYITEKAFNESSLRLNKPGDILIAMYGATIGKLGILKFEATTNQACCACTTYNGLYNMYLYYFLMANKQRFIDSGEGGAQPNISKEKIVDFIMALPPTNEQYRIVARIELLMSEIDKLKEVLLLKENLKEQLPKAVVDAIGKCQTGDELKEQLQFVIENFNVIFQTPGSMQELRNVILQLAIEGKLLPQASNDEPASELVKRIKEEKEKLVKEGKIKKDKPLPKIEEDEMPFEIPESWIYDRLNNVIDVRDGTHDTPQYVSNREYPLITGKDFYNGHLSFEKTQYISQEDYLKIIQRSKVDKYDILFSMIGGNIGSMVMIEDDIDIAIKNVALFKYYQNDLILPKYLFYYLKANVENIKKFADGGAQKFVSLSKLRNLIIAIPPHNEQIRIIQKVESIMQIIDQLENKLKGKVELVEMMATA